MLSLHALESTIAGAQTQGCAITVDQPGGAYDACGV